MLFFSSVAVAMLQMLPCDSGGNSNTIGKCYKGVIKKLFILLKKVILKVVL